MTARSWAPPALVTALLLLLPACILVPAPEHGLLEGRGSISREDLAFLAQGVTTREEVLLRFGEPDARLQGDGILAYRWAVIHGYYLVGGYTVGYAGPIGKNYLLLLAFDEAGRLQRWRVADAMVHDPSHLLRAWAEGKPLPHDSPAPAAAPAAPPPPPAP